jgi:hypothetical protein
MKGGLVNAIASMKEELAGAGVGTVRLRQGGHERGIQS